MLNGYVESSFIPNIEANDIHRVARNEFENCVLYTRSILSFLGSTAQLRPWPPPQNPAEFLGGFSTIFFFTG
jgi:hypothetical protein